MDTKKLVLNIFSNWTFFALSIGASFLVSPILVHRLGNEQYGIWVLVNSIVGYFTVMDFGVNTAVVRFISKYDAENKKKYSRDVYSNACIIFVSVSVLIALICLILGLFFPRFFHAEGLSDGYIYVVFILAGFELATLMGTGMYTGVMHAKHEFVWLNIINIIVLAVKNIVLVILLISGFSLMGVAIIHLSATILRSSLRYIYIKKKHKHLTFKAGAFDVGIMKMIFGYSVYSFFICIALKVLFFTDSIVIGTFLTVSAVTFYAIPMTLMTYLEQIVHVGVTVLTPIISTNDAVGDHSQNKNIYIWVSRYALVLSLPVIFVLFTNGDSFISLWMGRAYGEKSTTILQILCIGYIAYLSQLIATELLMGISRHRFVAFVYIIEAVANLGISIILIKFYGYGLEGAAYGTTIPLVVVNLLVVPLYTCRVIGLNYLSYVLKNNFLLYSFTIFCGILFYYFYPFKPKTYLHLGLYSTFILVLFLSFSFVFVVNSKHRKACLQMFLKKIHP